MVPFKTRTGRGPAAANICLDRTPAVHNEPVTYHTDQAIEGYVQIGARRSVDVVGEITLRGTAWVNVAEEPDGHSRASMQRHWKATQYDFLSVTRHLRSSCDVAALPFCFNLKECQRMAASLSLSTDIPDLPPSVDSRKEGRSRANGQYSIAYGLTATLFAGDEVVENITEQIQVMPVTPSDRSLDAASAVGGEFFWAQSSMPRLKFLRTKSFPVQTRLFSSLVLQRHNTSLSPSRPATELRLELAAQEPAAMVCKAFEPGSSGHGSTDISFLLKVVGPPKAQVDEALLPRGCHMRFQLNTKTSITPDGYKQIETTIITGRDKLPKSQCVDVEIDKSHAQEHSAEISPSQWEHLAFGSGDAFAIARFSAPFHINSGKLPMPSFTTLLVSRTYAIDIGLSFTDSSFTQTMSLLLPLRIYYQNIGNISSIN